MKIIKSILLFVFVFSLESIPLLCQCVHLLKDINPGPPDGGGKSFVEFDDHLYFLSTNSIWKTDGSTGGTVYVGGPFWTVHDLFTFNGKLYLIADVPPLNFYQLHQVNTSTGTASIFLDKDNNPVIIGCPPVVFDGHFYFDQRNTSYGNEIWKSDGTFLGTELFMDINPLEESSNPEYFYEYNDHLYFSANDGIHGNELWKTDGTVNGTSLVKDIFDGPEGFISEVRSYAIYQGLLYFTATNAAGSDDVWMTNGSSQGTIILKDINPGANSSVNHLNITSGLLIFMAKDLANGYELWKSDGTTAGTSLLKDINPGPDGVSVHNSYPYNDKVIFGLNDQVNGSELWISDGTPIGTHLIKDINPSGSSIFYPLTSVLLVNYRDLIYFAADDGVHGAELWKTDGTADGTKLVFDLNPGIPKSNINEYAVFKEHLIVSAENEMEGREVWMIDGSPSGNSFASSTSANFWGVGTSWLNGNIPTFCDNVWLLSGSQMRTLGAFGSPIGGTAHKTTVYSNATLTIFANTSLKITSELDVFLGAEFDVQLGSILQVGN